MDPKFASVLKGIKRGETVSVELSDDDVMNLLELLNFAFETSKFIIDDAGRTGEKILGHDKIKRYMFTADDLMVKVYNSVDLQGAPPKSERH